MLFKSVDGLYYFCEEGRFNEVLVILCILKFLFSEQILESDLYFYEKLILSGGFITFGLPI